MFTDYSGRLERRAERKATMRSLLTPFRVVLTTIMAWWAWLITTVTADQVSDPDGDRGPFGARWSQAFDESSDSSSTAEYLDEDTQVAEPYTDLTDNSTPWRDETSSSLVDMDGTPYNNLSCSHSYDDL